jgi:hypothetical protein
MDKSTSRLALYFTSPKTVEVREETVPPLKPENVLVRSEYSAISSGTELLIYRHLISLRQPLDVNIPSFLRIFIIPLNMVIPLSEQ